MQIGNHVDRALAILAAYDTPFAGAYEKRVAQLARRWLRMLRSRSVRQRMVNDLLDELDHPPPECDGCGWDELRRAVRQWAIEEEWIRL